MATIPKIMKEDSIHEYIIFWNMLRIYILNIHKNLDIIINDLLF